MATSGSVNSGGYQGRVLQFSWNTQSINSATNVRTISYTITAVGGSSSKYYHHNNTVSINDTNVYSGGTSDYITTNTVLKTGTFSINQSSTTTLTVKMNGGIYVYSDNINTTQSWTLDTIPRYTTISTFKVDKASETSLKITWQTADTIDYAWYSTDNGATWAGHDVTDGTSGNFVISKLSSNTSTNLSANTKYNCKLRVRRKDSQLNTDSGTVAQTTYDYPYCTNTPNFLIGDSVTLTFYNPLSRNIKIELIGANNAVCDTTNITGTSISGYNGSATISNLYATIPNSNSGKYKVRVTYGSSVKTRENNNTYTIKANSSNPTFSNFDYADTNTTTTNLTGNPLILVKGYSNNKITIGTDKKATAKNSATMKTYKVVQGNKTSGDLTYSSSAAVTATLNAIDNNVITVSATDSRGNSTSVTKTLNSTYYKAYSPIAITSVSVTRSNNGVGKIVTLKLNGTYWNNSFGTTTNDIINARYQYKVASSSGSFSSLKTLSLTKSGANFSYNGTIEGDLGAEGFSVEDSFTVRVRIQDRLQEKIYDITLGPGSPAIAIYKGNVAIGQKYDTNEGGKLQVKGNTSVDGVLRTGSASGARVGVGAGSIEIYNTTPYIDFHFGNSTADYTSRIIETASGTLSINGKVLKDSGTRGIKTRTSKGNLGWGTNNDYIPDLGMLAYWDGAYASNNASNLTYAHQGTIQCKPTNLYNNSSGTTGTVTLSQTAANFDYLEIFYGKGGERTSVKVSSPNGKAVRLVSGEYASSASVIQMVYAVATISGTSITKSLTYYANFKNDGSNTIGIENGISIYKVIGYK